MTTIDIEIRGLKETQANMERIVRDLRGEPYLNAMRRATLLVQRSAKIKAPVDTGRLRASITPEVRMQGNLVTGVVGSNVKYAPFVELGFRPHRAILSPASWAQMSSTHHLLNWAFARISYHNNTSGAGLGGTGRATPGYSWAAKRSPTLSRR